MIHSKSKTLHRITKENFKIIIDFIKNTHIHQKELKITEDICYFCWSDKELTREHVMPKWTFEWSTEKNFSTNINGLSQSYIKTTIPACSSCNNTILSLIELNINRIFSEKNLQNSYLSNSNLEDIIIWLETIDYKFHILNTRRTFLTSKEHWYIPYLSYIPLIVMQPNIDYSPSRSITAIRHSLKRLGIKNKIKSINSLVIFESKNTNFYFFHTMNEFIFIELPQYKIALFYF